MLLQGDKSHNTTNTQLARKNEENDIGIIHTADILEFL
jgi:hypothetical protein